jgi:hypothetical protein
MLPGSGRTKEERTKEERTKEERTKEERKNDERWKVVHTGGRTHHLIPGLPPPQLLFRSAQKNARRREMKKTKVEEKGVVKEEAKGEPGGARRRENRRQKRREKRVERKKEMKRKMVVNPAPGRANDHVKAPKVSLYSAHSVETLPVLELYPSPCRQPAIMLPLALEMKGGLKGGAPERAPPFTREYFERVFRTLNKNFGILVQNRRPPH